MKILLSTDLFSAATISRIMNNLQWQTTIWQIQISKKSPLFLSLTANLSQNLQLVNKLYHRFSL